MNTQTLERGTITVQHIFPAKAQGKSAYIKDVDGMMFGIWPDKLGLINVGETYEIEFSANVKNGTTYRDIKNAKMVTQTQPARSLSSAAPSERIEPQRPATPYDKGNYRQATPPGESLQMFTCNILGHFIDTGRIDCDRNHIAAAIKEIIAGYVAGFDKG